MLSPRLDGGATNVYSKQRDASIPQRELHRSNISADAPVAATGALSTGGSDDLLREWYPRVADAWAQPEPRMLVATRVLELIVGSIILLMLFVSVGGILWISAADARPSTNWPHTAALIQYVALPITLFVFCTYAVVAFLASFPQHQAYIAFLHFVKYFPAASASGPYDPAASSLFPRSSAASRTCADSPHVAGLPHTRVLSIRTHDGESLGAWHVLPAGASAFEAALRTGAGQSAAEVFDDILRRDASRRSSDGASGGRGDEDEVGETSKQGGAVAAVYLHGMGETRTKWCSTEHAKLLTAHLGVHVLCIDYRGFGDSTGHPSEAGLNADAEAALAWLAERGVAPSQVLVWGHSLGTGPALHLASSLELSERPLHGVVLEAPYTSLIDAAVTFPSAFLIRALPFGHQLIRRYFYYQWHNFRILPHLKHTRVLVLHGTHDLIVPFVHTVELARQVAAARRRVGVVREAAHRADDDPERAPRSQWTAREMLHQTQPQVEIVPLLGAGHLNCLFQPTLLQALSRFACFPCPRAAAQRA